MSALARPVRPYPYADVVAALARVGPCTVAALARQLPYHESTIRSKLYGADPAAGHAGGIYKATNWTYEGLTDSDRKTPRWDYYLNGRRVGRASHAGIAATKIRRQPKHRFSMAL